MQEKKTKKTFNRSNSTMKMIRFEDELLAKIQEQINTHQGTFAGWVKEACKQRLERDKAIKKL